LSPISCRDGDGALLAGLLEAGHHRGAVVGLATAVLLDDERQHLLDPLVGGEAPAAADALAPPADDLFVVAGTGVHDFVFGGGAERTAHGKGCGYSLPPL
jgi:hypothetical protein